MKWQRIARRDKKAFLNEQWKEVEEHNRMGKTRDLFKKIRDIKRTFHVRIGTINNINGNNLTVAEEIKKRWQEYTEELYKKSLNDPNDYEAVVTHLESDFLEYKVKWALWNISTNKAIGCGRIPAELFQVLKMMLLKCCTQYVSKFGKLSHGHRTGKSQFLFQSQRKTMPKNVQTIISLYSFHMLARLCSKSFKLGSAIHEPRTFRCTNGV